MFLHPQFSPPERICGAPPLCSRQGIRNRQLLSLPSEEGEGAALSLPHGVRQGFPGTGEGHLNRLSNTSILQPGQRERSGRICSHPWICFISPASTQEKMLGKNHIYTNCSAPLLFPGQLQTPLQGELQGEEGGDGPLFAIELDHPRRVQRGTLIRRCFSTLGCSILILVASRLFSELLPAVLSPSPSLPTSTELVTPSTKLAGGLWYK